MSSHALPPSFLLSLSSFGVGRLQLNAGQEALGQPSPVVAQVGGVDGAGVLGVDDGGALVPLHPLPGLEIQLGLVAPPGAVGQREDRLAALVQAQAPGLHGDVVDEVPVGVVTH